MKKILKEWKTFLIENQATPPNRSEIIRQMQFHLFMPAYDKVRALMKRNNIPMPSSEVHSNAWGYASGDLSKFIDEKTQHFMAEVRKENSRTGEKYLSDQEIALLAHDSKLLAQGLKDGSWLAIPRTIKLPRGGKIRISVIDFQRSPMSDWVLGGSFGIQAPIYLFSRLSELAFEIMDTNGIPSIEPTGETEHDVVDIYSGIPQEEIRQASLPPDPKGRMASHPALNFDAWKKSKGLAEGE